LKVSRIIVHPSDSPQTSRNERLFINGTMSARMLWGRDSVSANRLRGLGLASLNPASMRDSRRNRKFAMNSRALTAAAK